jgi:hypothetical protein
LNIPDIVVVADEADTAFVATVVAMDIGLGGGVPNAWGWN